MQHLLIVVTDILLPILNADAIDVLLRYQLVTRSETDTTRRSMVPSGWAENGLYNTPLGAYHPIFRRKNNFPSLFQPIYAL